MTMFGWCMAGQHTLCIHKFQRFFIANIGRGRKKKPNAVNPIDEYIECGCYCHNPDRTAPTTKKRRRKA